MVKASAKARTFSLFTGKKDLEALDAPDGTRPGYLPAYPRKQKYEWQTPHGALIAHWEYGRTVKRAWVRRGQVSCRNGTYHAECLGETRTFRTLVEAAKWVEESAK